MLSIYGKTRSLVPPCGHLPTLRHRANSSTELEEREAYRSKVATLTQAKRKLNGEAKASPAAARANNHIWHTYNKEEQ